MKKIYLLFALMLGVISFSTAQHRLKRIGDEHFKMLSYELAIPYYTRFLKRFDDADATQKLADCYRLTHRYDEAAEWYSKVMSLPSKPAITHFHYGHTLLQQGNNEEALQQFKTYSKLVPEDPRGKNYITAIAKMADLYKDSIRVAIDHLSFNTPDAEFGWFPYKNGFIVASARDLGSPIVQDFNWLDKPFLDLYYIEPKKDSSGFEKAVKLKGDANTKYHESSYTSEKDASEFYFTRNNYYNKKKGKNDDGIILLKIYKAKINDLETSEVEDFAFNSDKYSVTHPSISADGQVLYFVSDMPGGVGGKDIYLCRKQGGGWSQPENVRTVNTPGDEMFPFIHPDGTLYFSSDGHPGLGHLDLFYMKANAKGGPVNMGYPLNSPFDDFAVWLNQDNTEGYLSSDREGGAGSDDIYHFNLAKPTLEIIVLDSMVQAPLDSAKITLVDLTDNSIKEYYTDISGSLLLDTEFGHEFKVKVEATNFRTKEVSINTDIGKGTLEFSYTVELYSPPPSFSGIVIDDTTLAKLPGSYVEFVNLREGTAETKIADKNGRFFFNLKPNTLYEINARHKGYLTYTDQIQTSATAIQGDTVIPLKMKRIPFNKPIALKNIHYDFDKWTIRYDAYNDLIFVANLMKKNPTLIVELGSHTDCRGSDVYNEKLAQKRANSARYFIIDLGIDPNRIVAKGYGEYKPSNECVNGVPCSEDKHFANRRTEFTIIGEIEGIDMEKSILKTQEGNDPPPVYVPENRQNPTNVGDNKTPQPAPSAGKQDDGSVTGVVVPVTPSKSFPSTDPSQGKLNLPDAKFDPGAVVDAEKTIFRIKIGGFMGTLSESALARLGGFQAYAFYMKDAAGLYTYYVGDYSKHTDATLGLEQVKEAGFYGAYLTAFKGGKELSFGELKTLLGQ